MLPVRAARFEVGGMALGELCLINIFGSVWSLVCFQGAVGDQDADVPTIHTTKTRCSRSAMSWVRPCLELLATELNDEEFPETACKTSSSFFELCLTMQSRWSVEETT